MLKQLAGQSISRLLEHFQDGLMSFIKHKMTNIYWFTALFRCLSLFYNLVNCISLGLGLLVWDIVMAIFHHFIGEAIIPLIQDKPLNDENNYR